MFLISFSIVESYLTLFLSLPSLTHAHTYTHTLSLTPIRALFFVSCMCFLLTFVQAIEIVKHTSDFHLLVIITDGEVGITCNHVVRRRRGRGGGGGMCVCVCVCGMCVCVRLL